MAYTYYHNIDLNAVSTTTLARWVKKELEKQYGKGQINFTIDFYECSCWGYSKKIFLGNYSSIKEACEENEHICYLVHSKDGVYYRDYVLEYAFGKDNDHNEIICYGDDKRECYIKFLNDCDTEERRKTYEMESLV